ncbi:transglutaminase family protein [Aliarcobacter butzleri]|uniref:transglutaminase family protein n=1 Tax=Aliarcobacter butzleri TaxID=28197 RepID=UPI001EDBEED4|nr:transglutaminase family protein [Aliarcobacter butzleri]MCG3677348.1 transglutaminase family protein [Aliarcobacter butzleri]MCG3706534.1 transglutaminase family protein [Aliarcobacter butzleri]MCT7568807.1 transglutaminase family protein [Aliarcobacter butzleri]
MALKVVISHKTHYKYDRKISLSPHIIRLRPAPHSRTPIEAYSLKIKPDNHFINWQQDPFGNYLARLVFPEKTDEFCVDVEIIADMITINPFDFFVEDSAKNYPFEYKKDLQEELKPYLKIDENNKILNDFVDNIDKKEKSIIDFLVEVNQKINSYLDYTVRLEPGVQSCKTTLEKKLGSCRDFAWLFVQVLRHLGLASRFVSGYLVQLTADVKSLDGPSGPEADFTDLHAWTEVYIPGAGWIGLDSTSGLFAGEGHIPLSCTPHYNSAHAIEGFSDKCETEFFFENKVTRIFESPRVTKPYKDEQWKAIYNLGFKVDEDLIKNDVRLTMGGEPTFVSIDDMESAQWNTQADGEHKRELANNLSRKILSSSTNGGLLHHAQGKWYPGEPLPRWQTTIYWRKDGKPVWKNPDLLANMNTNYSFTTHDAKRFISTLALILGVSDENIIPAFEDPIYYIMKEAELPIDIDPLKYDLKDPLERKTIAQKLTYGLNNEVGYVLPLNFGFTKWITSKWEFRRGNLFLSAGNSPIGFRLPLESLIVKPQVELDQDFQADLFASYPVLGDYISEVEKRAKNINNKTTLNNKYSTFVRTALSIEVRDNKLCIFLPPIEKTEVFLDLIASIEETASRLNMAVIIEGYEPPYDLRTDRIKVTPDPGVIEVNIQPASSWKELSDNLLKLYEDARVCRLGTEKFMIDGRHTGTGGGNHVTIGAMEPSDSPLLRNPNLLRSLITFWQHHPGLSYLFSGAFIGPTSQAPRVDEGRVENLYELEIAFSQIPEDGDVPYWLTDRLFRHLLTDITGNTHRSEFCIDKLYSPDSSSGRLGILELRAFDMPPHSQMALLQMLLVRALVSCFWKKPYKHNLIRWGTRLHDKFLLEHYVKEDLKSVVEYLNDEGYEFKLDWFDPFFEFRFPLYGMTIINGMHVEIRAAIEPWHVLGEESGSQGTSRYVDSSLERLQIKIQDFNEERYVISCNGVQIPLTRTEVEGEFVSGVRYKAWQPWSALHPTIKVDTPLTFDIIDKWNMRSIGGFNYFVSHPGGRSYDTFPVNSYEAESRRINRYWDFNHSQGEVTPMETQLFGEANSSSFALEASRSIKNKVGSKKLYFHEMPKNKEYPHTLDLRQRWIKN